MRGMIMEIQDGQCLVMTSSGRFIRIKAKKGMMSGEMIRFSRVNFLLTALGRVRVQQLATVMSLVFMVSVFSWGAWAWFVPVTWVDVDINPSVELSVNYFGKVIGTKALNQDAAPIVKALTVRGRDVNTAVTETIQTARQLGYSDKADAGLMISVSGADLEVSERTRDALKEAVTAMGTTPSESLTVAAFQKETWADAKEMGVSPGRLRLAEKALSLHPEESLDSLLKAPVSIVQQKIRAAVDPKKTQKQWTPDDEKVKITHDPETSTPTTPAKPVPSGAPRVTPAPGGEKKGTVDTPQPEKNEQKQENKTLRPTVTATPKPEGPKKESRKEEKEDERTSEKQSKQEERDNKRDH